VTFCVITSIIPGVGSYIVVLKNGGPCPGGGDPASITWLSEVEWEVSVRRLRRWDRIQAGFFEFAIAPHKRDILISSLFINLATKTCFLLFGHFVI